MRIEVASREGVGGEASGGEAMEVGEEGAEGWEFVVDGRRMN